MTKYPKRSKIYLSDSELFLLEIMTISHADMFKELAKLMSEEEYEGTETFSGTCSDIIKIRNKLLDEIKARGLDKEYL